MKRRRQILLISPGSLLIAGVLAATPAGHPRPEDQNPPATISFQGREIPNTLDEISQPEAHGCHCSRDDQ